MLFGRVGHTDNDQRLMLEYEASGYMQEARQKGRNWWEEKKQRLIKRRGKASVQKLTDEMNRQRYEQRRT